MRVVGIEGVRPVLPDVGVEESFAMKLAFQGFQIGGHISLRNRCARRLCNPHFSLRAKHSARNARDHPARHEPHGFRAQPIREAGNHRTLSRRKRRKPHARDLLRRFPAGAACDAAARQPEEIRFPSIRGKARTREFRTGRTSSARPSANCRSKDFVAAYVEM